MAAKIIDGKAVAARVKAEVAERGGRARAQRRASRRSSSATTPPPRSTSRMKREDSAEVGIESFHHEPGGDVPRTSSPR